MNGVSGFEKIAQHLTHPLVLVGFVLMLVFGIHGALIKSGLLRSVSQKESGRIVRLILRYGFQLGMLIVILGVVVQLLK